MKVIREGEQIVAFRHWFRWYYTIALEERGYIRMFERDEPNAKR